MSIVDTQICKTLDRLHAETAGRRKPCRWSYDAKQDTYSCEHISVAGRDIIRKVNPHFLEE